MICTDISIQIIQLVGTVFRRWRHWEDIYNRPVVSRTSKFRIEGFKKFTYLKRIYYDTCSSYIVFYNITTMAFQMAPT